MHNILKLAAIAAFATMPALADTTATAPKPAAAATATPAAGQKMKDCAAAWNAMTPAQKQATTYKAYSAKCLASSVPPGSTAQCKDGTYTQQKTHSGACSRHGGVAKWL